MYGIESSLLFRKGRVQYVHVLSAVVWLQVHIQSWVGSVVMYSLMNSVIQ